MKTGYVNAKGESAVPAGIFDHSEGHESVVLDPDLEEALHQMYLEESLVSQHAKYKIDVLFTGERSALKPYPGIIALWTNGGSSHGGGDEVVYLCPTKLDTGHICNAPVGITFVSRRVAVCESCSQVHRPEHLTGQIFARLTNQNWSGLVLKVFNVLRANADIRIGMDKRDMRAHALAAVKQRSQGDVVNSIRLERQWVTYPLNAIIKDVGNGSDLQTRIRAFIEA